MSICPAIYLKKIEIAASFIQTSFKVFERCYRSWKKHYKQIFALNQGDKIASEKMEVFAQDKKLQKVWASETKVMACGINTISDYICLIYAYLVQFKHIA